MFLHTKVHVLTCQVTRANMPNYTCRYYQTTCVCLPKYTC